MSLNNLQAGQFVELEVPLSNSGCYIQADKRVGICAFYVSDNASGYGGAAPAWLSPIEQSVANAVIAPFISDGPVTVHSHYATVFTPTLTRENTKVSIGGAPATDLFGGSWIENTAANMSYYKMPLTNGTAANYFTNSAGFLILCYGYGNGNETYYYISGSAMRDLDAAFYANDIHFQELKDTVFCAGNVNFRAEIEGDLHTDPVSLKWYIDGVEEVSAQDQQEWNKPFSPGEYTIKMWVRFENNDTISKTGTLKIKACDYAFFANNVHHLNLIDTTFCNKDVVFRAEIENLHTDPGSLIWYIDNIEYTPARDLLQWSKAFESGVYQIKMVARFDNDEIATITGTLKMDVFWIKIRNVRY
jgi:hypothetical protein